MKYRKKPVEIEAVQFIDTPERICEIAKFVGGYLRVNYEDKDNPYIPIETLEGTMKASVGDYIIKGVNGEFYPCKPDIFVKTYDSIGSQIAEANMQNMQPQCNAYSISTFKILQIKEKLANAAALEQENLFNCGSDKGKAFHATSR